jgi:hypothetical protein
MTCTKKEGDMNKVSEERDGVKHMDIMGEIFQVEETASTKAIWG